MIASAHADPARRVSRSRVTWFASIVFCGVFPAAVVVVLLLTAIEDSAPGIDFGQFYWAAERILGGDTPYPDGVPEVVWGGPYPYPPFVALLTIPLTAVSLEAARILVMVLLVASALAILYVLQVRDWRCYGMALLWPPVLSAIQTGNLTLFLGLGAALCWRFRNRTVPASASVGAALAAKLFLWPLVIWLAASRRYASAVLAGAIGVALLVASWGAIGFDGLVGYPHRLRSLETYYGDDSYTLNITALDLGVPSPVARALWLALGLGLLSAVVMLARRGEERPAFAIALVAALALTPIVWLHYFALLLVVVALMRPTLGIVWFVPLAMVMTPGSGHPTTFETAWTLSIAALTVGLAFRLPGRVTAPRAEAVGT